MKVNDIIELESGARYALIDECSYENEKYFLASVVENDLAQKDKLLYIKLVKDNNEDYIEIVEDKELITKLSEKLKDTIK